MTKSAKREAAHHAAAAPSEQMSPYGAGVEFDLANHPFRMLRFREVIERTGLSRTTIWRRVRAKTFPAPIQLGPNSIGWPESVIIEWVESRPVVAYATDAA